MTQRHILAFLVQPSPSPSAVARDRPAQYQRGAVGVESAGQVDQGYGSDDVEADTQGQERSICR